LATGIKKINTNGICSNAHDKLFNDLYVTLPYVKSAMQALDAPNGHPSLAGGTFIPGYTVSKWKS
jgi:hypothetical protein